MPSEIEDQLESLLCAAIEIDSDAEREAYIDKACGTDSELRDKVKRLVVAHFQAGQFLKHGDTSLGDADPMQPVEHVGSRIGNYKLLEQIGEGGMGSVFMAEQSKPVQRQVALKIIKTGMDTRQVIARFEAERPALAIMDHPKIAKVFEAGSTDSGRPSLDGNKLRSAAFGEMLRMIREEEPLRPSKRLSSIETLASVSANRRMEPHKLSGLMLGELDWIVMMALEKERGDRYESANAFAADIQRYLAQEKVLACPPSLRYRLTKSARKHKVLLTTAGLLSVSLLLGTALSVWQAVRATNAQYQAKLVLDFYQGAVLSAARPKDLDGGLGKDVTLLQAINAAEPMISQTFSHQPLVEASVRDELGKTYRYLGEPKKAILQHRRAIDLRKSDLGPAHIDTPTSMLNLAEDYQDARELELTLSLGQETLLSAKSQLGENHLFTLACMRLLGNTYRGVGRWDDAAKLHEAELKIATKTVGR